MALPFNIVKLNSKTISFPRLTEAAGSTFPVVVPGSLKQEVPNKNRKMK